ncbi:MAG: hypothetical protein K2X53_00325 [Alphaproteobacteria bacterium]|nr:hypothetical protein [Alphaproteobacteria bacterium]
MPHLKIATRSFKFAVDSAFFWPLTGKCNEKNNKRWSVVRGVQFFCCVMGLALLWSADATAQIEFLTQPLLQPNPPTPGGQSPQVNTSTPAADTTLPHPVRPPVLYGGRLQCEHIELTLSQLPNALPRAFCNEALTGCLSLHHLDHLGPLDPLRIEIEEALESKVAFDFDKCELAIKYFDPDFYEKNLKR